jgi:hypothetical protein
MGRRRQVHQPARVFLVLVLTAYVVIVGGAILDRLAR